MAKTVSLNEFTYSKLAAMSGDLTSIARKPVSLGMTMHVALIVLEVALEYEPELTKTLKDAFRTSMSPEEFDKHWDRLYKSITKRQN